MSKRFFPQQCGERKKAKLDVTISDHNFPLSQNPGPSKDINQDTWGDDNDDEILLLASQACESAYDDIGSLPDYSICMQPPSTSTQILDPAPSTSKSPFSFKKPSGIPPSSISTNLKDKCSRISSPLPGIASKIAPQTNTNNGSITDDLIFNDKIYKNQDSEFVYRQLLQLQEENAKLKSENGKLLEKCVTKEGEASILRTQLKNCQRDVDNARMERIKAQEKAQIEWNDKLQAVNSQMHDLRNQLDFKNLEIISIKEKCKLLESNKVKLTQVTLSHNDLSVTHSHRNSLPNDSAAFQRRVKMITNGVQTDDKAVFVKLNKSFKLAESPLQRILPLALEPSAEQHSLLEYDEKLQRHHDLSQIKCKTFSTFHWVPSTPITKDNNPNKTVSLKSIHKDLTAISTQEFSMDNCINVLKTIKQALLNVSSQLELISSRVSSGFLRSADERYIESATQWVAAGEAGLIAARSLYKEEQAIPSRRMVAILGCALRSSAVRESFRRFEELSNTADAVSSSFIDLVFRICNLLDVTSCAVYYSGLLLSIIKFLDHFTETPCAKIIEILRCIISSRPMTFVSCEILSLMRKISLSEGFVGQFCPNTTTGNLKLDYDQGVLLYKKDSCHLQVLWKQVEVALKCIEKSILIDVAVTVARDLVATYSNLYASTDFGAQDKARCECQLVLMQVIVYALSICAAMVERSGERNKALVCVCRCGLQAVWGWAQRDIQLHLQLGSRLGLLEGHLLQFTDIMRSYQHSEPHANMLTELSSTFQTAPEDVTSSYHRQAWLTSFQSFSLTD